MIKAIILDVGGIVFDYKPFLEDFLAKAEEITKLSQAEIKKYLMDHLADLEKGESLSRFWEGLVADPEKAILLADEYLLSYQANFCDNEEISDLIRRMSQHFLLVCFSNIGVEQAEVNKSMDLYELFPIVVLSSDYGLRKPERKFYDILNEVLNDEEVQPDECVFVDDQKGNLTIPEELGMKTILYTDAKQLTKELDSLVRN